MCLQFEKQQNRNRKTKSKKSFIYVFKKLKQNVYELVRKRQTNSYSEYLNVFNKYICMYV